MIDYQQRTKREAFVHTVFIKGWWFWFLLAMCTIMILDGTDGIHNISGSAVIDR